MTVGKVAGKTMATDLGISAGIVAERFHFDGIWKPFSGNELKVGYQIDELLSDEAMV